MPKHLWEIDHPYYGADGYLTEFDSFAELREAADALDDHMNHIYRWDWRDYSQDPGGQELWLYFVMPRKSGFLAWSCPITHEQEAEVLAWLRGPRVLGALRAMWEPLLDGTEAEIPGLLDELDRLRRERAELVRYTRGLAVHVKSFRGDDPEHESRLILRDLQARLGLDGEDG